MNEVKAQIYIDSVEQRLRLAEQTNSPSINFMTSEIEQMHEMLVDYLKMLRKEQE